MKKIEEFAKLLSGNAELMKKFLDEKCSVEALVKLAKEKGFDFTAEELTPLAMNLAAVLKKANGETLTDDEKKIVSHVEAKAKEMKLPDDALAVVAGGQKEGYDTPTSVGKVDGVQWFPVAVVAVIAAASAVAVVAAVAVDVVTGVTATVARK